MADKFPPSRQRPRLVTLADKLCCSLIHLRRDTCDDWMLEGKFGHIYAVFDTYQILVMSQSIQGYNSCKREFSAFPDLTIDCDGEGGFMLDCDPTADEAKVIRRRVGLKKRQTYDEKTLAAMRERAKVLADRT